ncbi:MAG: hypothetical protein FJ279_15920, partial [Planctomycetes bacterium]|nr:hypothetical protein [Planctomycetota bacterium]
MTRLATCLVAILSLLMISPALLGQPVGEVSVPVCAAPPRLDADLNDPCWAAATKLTGFRAIATSKSAEVQTTAWLCRDDTWLYIAFRCHEPSAISIKRTVNDRDAAVSSDDSVEIFLDPGTGGKEYVHLALNVNGAQADQLCRGEERLRSWNMPWRSAAKLDAHLDSATGWSAELAIPLALVPGRQPNALWRINLCRNRRAVSPAEHSSLAPLPPGASFHAPQHFLPVKLSGLKLQVPFGPMVRSATAKPFTIKDGAYSYAIEVVVRNLTGSAGEVDVVAQDLPRTGQGRQVAEKLALGPSEEKQVTFRIQAAHAGPRDAWVGLREPGSELWLQKTHVAGMEELSRLDAYLDRSYYTTEKQARVYAEMRTDREDRVAQGLVLDVKLTGPAKEPLAAGSTPCSDDVVAINLDISRVPNGAHTVEAVLRNKAGVELGSVQLPLIKRPPAPDGANEVKIDRYNRCLLLNGKPFFPLGAVGAHYHGRFADWKADYFDAQFKFCREAGLNCVIDWVGYRPADTPLEDTRKCYDLAHQHGLKVIGRPYGSGRDLRYSSPKFRDAAAEMIAAMDPYLAMCLRHPAVVAFYHLDEPQPGLSIDDTLQAFTDKVHSLAPYHPVYVSLTRYIHESQRRWFGTITDLLGAHNYWYVLRADGLQAMSGYWRALDTHARNAHSPTMALPQLDYWGPGYQNCDFMLPAEQRAQTYLALVHGARSVIYFVLPFRHQLSVATQKQLSAEVARLAPALLSREPRQEVTFEPESASTVFPLG